MYAYTSTYAYTYIHVCICLHTDRHIYIGLDAEPLANSSANRFYIEPESLRRIGLVFMNRSRVHLKIRLHSWYTNALILHDWKTLK